MWRTQIAARTKTMTTKTLTNQTGGKLGPLPRPIRLLGSPPTCFAAQPLPIYPTHALTSSTGFPRPLSRHVVFDVASLGAARLSKTLGHALR